MKIRLHNIHWKMYKSFTKVRSPDRDTDYFDIAAGVQQGNILAPYLFIICLDCVLRTYIDKMKDNSFNVTERRSITYTAQTITDAKHADDIALLANTPTETQTLQHSLERAAAGIGIHVDADKTEYLCFNKKGDNSTLNSSSLKLVDKLTYLGTETDINTWLTKAWSAIDRL